MEVRKYKEKGYKSWVIKIMANKRKILNEFKLYLRIKKKLHTNKN